jgi:hypothetical protein
LPIVSDTNGGLGCKADVRFRNIIGLSIAINILYINLSANLHHSKKENKMNYRIMFLINAFLAVLLGLGFLAVPDRVLDQFGVDGYAATKLVSQFFGTALLGLGLLLWFAKDVTDANLQKGMGIALLIGAVAGLGITVLGATSGVLRANWWIAMVVYALLGGAYTYLVFLKPIRLSQA